MIEHRNVIPVAVVAAVIIFLAKEVLEAIRRWRSNNRKLHAIRKFLAAECERNNFSINRLLSQLTEIGKALAANQLVEIKNRQATIPRLVIHTIDGEGSSPVPQIHKESLNKYLFAVASLECRPL